MNPTMIKNCKESYHVEHITSLRMKKAENIISKRGGQFLERWVGIYSTINAEWVTHSKRFFFQKLRNVI